MSSEYEYTNKPSWGLLIFGLLHEGLFEERAYWRSGLKPFLVVGDIELETLLPISYF